MLTNAVAVELSDDAAKKAEQVAFNENLIARSKGYLAGHTGEERYLTLGCGHTVAFCRGVNERALTSQPEIATADGKIDYQKICSDAEFSVMVNEGWDWDIIPSWIDEAFPKFADCAQKALNAANHVASQVGEIETAKVIADVMHDNTDESWDKVAVAAVRSTGAPAAPYCETLLEFVKLYTGGNHAPLLTFLDTVAKEFHLVRGARRDLLVSGRQS